MKLFKWLIITTLIFNQTVFADIYKWVDESGIIQFSNMPLDGENGIVEQFEKDVNESKEQPAAPENIFNKVDSAFNSKDYSKAQALLKPLAEGGNPRAQNALGMIYDRGMGVPRNLKEALRWYRKAAEQGYVLAQSYLGSMYATGEGVSKDSVEAARWYRKAAIKGNDFSQFNLALMYIKGEGVSQDYREAYQWIRKAAAQGYPLHFDFDNGWKVGHYVKVPNQYTITEFIPEGDEINNWKEMLTIQSFPPLWGGSSPEKALNKLKTIRENKCPGMTKWNVIGKSSSSILYEWQAKSCLGWPDQHEVAIIIHRKYNTLILHYALKVTQMPTEQRAKWIKKFSNTE